MAWQDIVLAAGGVVLALGIIPTLRGPDKPSIFTTISMAIVLAIFFSVFLTLKLWLTAAGVGVQSLMWCVVLYQTVRIRREGRVVARVSAPPSEVVSGPR